MLQRLTRVVLLATLAAAPAFASLFDPDDRWVRVETANFTLVSNASSDFAERIGLQLESLRQVLAKLKPDGQLSSPRPTTIYVFKSDESFEPFKHRYRGQPANVQGVFLTDGDANFVGLAPSAGTRTARVVFHEYLHFFTHNNMPNIPTWVDEGLAEYYSTFEVEDDKVVLGKPVMSHVQALVVSRHMPMGKLLEVTPRSAGYNEEDRQGVFYAQSWLAVHYIHSARPELIPRLDDFIDRSRRPLRAVPAAATETSSRSIDLSAMRDYMKSVREGDDALVRAFQEAFDVSADEFGRLLEAYRKGAVFPARTIPLEELEVDTRTTVAELTAPEALTYLGDFLIRSRDEEPKLARSCFDRAVALAPEHAAAHRGLGLVAVAENQPADAEAAFRKAIELDPDDVIAMKHLAGQLLDRAIEAEQIVAPEPVEEASVLLRRAIELAPDWADLRAIYGHALLLQVECDPGVGVLEAAATAMPSRLDVVGNWIILMASCGDVERARRVLEERFDQGVSPSMLPLANEAVIAAEWERVSELVAAGKYDESEAWVERMIETTQDAGLKGQLVQRLEQMRRQNAANRFVDRFNEGVELINRRKLPEAAAKFREVVEGSPDPELVATAKRYLEQMAPYLK